MMNFVHIRNPKCGSNTIDAFIRQSGGSMINNQGLLGNFLPRHATAEISTLYLSRYDTVYLSEAIWISSVREPIARAESAYLHLANKKRYPNGAADRWVAEQWLKIPNDEEMFAGCDDIHVLKCEAMSDGLNNLATLLNIPITETPSPRNSRKQRQERQRKRTGIVDTEEFIVTESTKNAIRDHWSWTYENYYSPKTS